MTEITHTETLSEDPFTFDGEGFGDWDGSKLPMWLVHQLAPLTARARATRLTVLLAALNAARQDQGGKTSGGERARPAPSDIYCDHVWTDPACDEPPCHCIKCGLNKCAPSPPGGDVEPVQELHELAAPGGEQEAASGRVGGYAPGNYMCFCLSCGETFNGDKRAYHCLACATALASPVLDVEDQGASGGFADLAAFGRTLKGYPDSTVAAFGLAVADYLDAARAKAHAPTLSQDGRIEQVEILVRQHFGPASITSGGAVSTPAGRRFAEDVVAMLAAPQPPESGWRTDMETAPRDGTRFVAAQTSAESLKSSAGFINSQGEFECVDEMGNPLGIGFYPTMWMPIFSSQLPEGKV